MKVYVVMEIGWEYNDENYYRPESAGGLPKVAYESKEDARVACAKMNASRAESSRWASMYIEHEINDKDEVVNKYVTEWFEVKMVELINV